MFELRDSAVALEWLQHCRTRADMRVERIDWAECKKWKVSPDHISHESGGFFSVVGAANPRAKERTVLLHQPEIGILGFLVRRCGSSYEWLAQAKAEPGN